MKQQQFVLLAGSLATLALLVSLGARLTMAQDATPVPITDLASISHPAHIHLGACDALSDVVFPLSDLTPVTAAATPVATDGTPVATEERFRMPGLNMDEVVSESYSTIDVSLADLIAGGYAINIHESADNIANYIACGEITDNTGGTQLQVDIKQLNGSGLEGLALLEANEDGSTKVTVMLIETELATPVASPAASPVAST